MDGVSGLFAAVALPSLDSRPLDRHRRPDPSPDCAGRPPDAQEEPTAMLHFSCDFCGKDLTPDGAARYVVKMEAYAATDPAQLRDEDLETDHVEEMAQLLNEIEDGGEPPTLLPACQKLRFDLCPGCYRKFVKDPLGRDSASRFDFSEN